MTEASVSFAGNLTDDPEVRSTEGEIARTVHLVAANRSDSCAAVTTNAVLTTVEARGQVPVG
jgi:hypothetical protein